MARKFAVVERDDEEESSSADEDEEEEEEEEEDEEEVAQTRGAPEATPRQAKQGGKLKIKIGGTQDAGGRCKVCGSTSHRAGFVGATYIDCPSKPCYLCKLPGHTTATCPFKITPGHGCTPAISSGPSTSLVQALMAREAGQGSRSPGKEGLTRTPQYQVEAAVYKLHTRRCCSLEFPDSSDRLVISGDKKGGIAVWDFDKVHERVIYSNIHTCLCNQIKMTPWKDAMSCCTASSDGTVKLVDLEVGSSQTLLNLNPQGWIQGGQWTMVYGCAADRRSGVVYAADSVGMVHVLDLRAPEQSVNSLQLHKREKIQSVDVHPLDSNLILTGGNDRTVKLFDVRAFSSSAGGPSSPTAPPSGKGKAASGAWVAPGELASMSHGKVVNSAYFSSQTGRKILTTCQDNRIRVWDSILDVRGPPSREVVHSNDFNRYLTPFKAEWDPKDPSERRFVIGRYISEEIDGVALHPIDIIDASSGQLLQELFDSNLTTISPVNKMHPRRDIIISGSSRSLYLWAPAGSVDADGGTSAVAAAASSSAGPDRLRAARPSSRFVFFDADPDVGGKKAGTKRKGAPGTKTGPGGDSDDD